MHMSKHITQDGSLDSVVERAIDRAVRRIMDVDPPAEFRRRVMSRLASRSPRVSFLPRFAVAAAALAAVVLAVFLLRPEPAPVSQPTQQAAATPPAVPVTTPAPSRPTSAEPQASVAQAPRRVVTDTPIRMPRISNVFGARDARVVAAAAEIEDVVFPKLPGDVTRDESLPGMPPPIEIPRITIAPLQIEQVRIEPMPIRQ
jgi:hypothetical protein